MEQCTDDDIQTMEFSHNNSAALTIGYIQTMEISHNNSAALTIGYIQAMEISHNNRVACVAGEVGVRNQKEKGGGEGEGT